MELCLFILLIALIIAISIATYFIINYNIINDVFLSLTKDYKDLADENVALKIVIKQYQRKLDEHEKECCLGHALPKQE